MADLTNVLGGPWSPPPEKHIDPPETQLIDAIRSAGMTPPERIILDGNIHRFRSGTKGDPKVKTDKPGWYVAFNDGVPAGRFGCWRSGIEMSWKADIGRKLYPEEMLAHERRITEAKAVHDAEIKRRQETASDVVNKIWSNAIAANFDHPYLKKKGIGVNGARITGDGRLIVPLFSQDGSLSSLQYITNDGQKLYHPGGQTGGKYWMIGHVDDPGPIYIAEGFATAATIHEVTDRPCVASYSASNLVPVTHIIRDIYGESQEIIVVADNDKSGVGQRYAEQACAKYGAKFVMPPIEGDANDYRMDGNDLSSILIRPIGKDVVDKLKVIFGNDLGDDYEIPDELVESMMTIGSSVVVYGDSNSGKTFFALSVAASIAEGSDCYGRKVDKGLVIYLASEAPASIRSRIQAIKKYYNYNLKNLAIVPVPMNFHSGDTDTNDIIELVRAVEEDKGMPVRLIIGDTLARMSAGANENSGEDMGPVMARFDKVANETGAAMMIIHHNGKDAARGARGWSGIRAHIDTEIEVAEKDGIRSATITKQRELPGKGDTIYFKLDVVEMGVTKFGGQATTCVAVQDNDAQESMPHKKMSKHDENVRTLERAWWSGGAEERHNLPYVSRDALRTMLINDGVSERTAKNKTEPSRQDGLIAKLLNSGIIEAHEKGWVFVNEVQISALLMRKNSR